MFPEPLLTIPQVLEVLGGIDGISERGLSRLTKSGAIPVVRIGRRVLIDPADLRAFIESRKSGGGHAENN
jgi:excisionase family DNA binding protein